MINDHQVLREAEWAFKFLADIARRLGSNPKASAMRERCQTNLARLQMARKPRGELVAVNDQGRRIGETHPRAKLTDEDVDLMFELHASRVPVAEIARKFEITRRHAGRVLSSQSRNHTPDRWVRR